MKRLAPALLLFWLFVPLDAALSAATVRVSFKNMHQTPDQCEFSQFSRDGAALAEDEIQVRTLSEGITEIYSSSPRLAKWEFHIREREPVYGFGERFNSLNQLSNIVKNASTDRPDAKGAASYKPIPFFMDLRGYGVWVDTYSEAVFDLGATSSNEFTIRLRDTHLRILFFSGPQFPVILERFTSVVGRAKLPPYWAFAPWKSRNWHPDMAAVYEDIEKYRALGLPASVLVLDSPWATNYNTFEMNRLQFTQPEKMVQHIHDLGFKLCLWLTAFIDSETLPPSEPELVGKIPPTAAANFAEADKAGYFVKNPAGTTYLVPWWKGTGGLIDFTNPAAVAWWQNQVRKSIRLGADAFKDDGGEGSFIGNAVFANGEDPAVMRTRYSVLYNQALEDLVQSDLHGDGVLLMRSGSIGNHNLPFSWAGDNEANFSQENGLPGVVRAGLNAGLSGISLWTNDLGGYLKSSRTPGDDILFVRWTEFSAFTPIMQLHSAINLGPWDYGHQALDIFRNYSRLHMSLFPYRYAAAQESSRTGMPLMRALVFFHPLDPESRQSVDEYYFGPDLLVAPVLSADTQRSIHLPEGEWWNYWSGKHYTGPANMAEDAPLDKIPLFVRSGSILPKIPDDVMTLAPANANAASPLKGLDDRRVYEIYPGPARDLDDFEHRHLTLKTTGGTTTLKITGAPAKITLVWRFQHPKQVMLNNHPLATQPGDDSASVNFAHTTESQLTWQQ